MVGDIIIDIDFALSQIGVHHRNLELADAYYMIQKHNDNAAEDNRRNSGS